MWFPPLVWCIGIYKPTLASNHLETSISFSCCHDYYSYIRDVLAAGVHRLNSKLLGSDLKLTPPLPPPCINYSKPSAHTVPSVCICAVRLLSLIRAATGHHPDPVKILNSHSITPIWVSVVYLIQSDASTHTHGLNLLEEI